MIGREQVEWNPRTLLKHTLLKISKNNLLLKCSGYDVLPFWIDSDEKYLEWAYINFHKCKNTFSRHSKYKLLIWSTETITQIITQPKMETFNQGELSSLTFFPFHTIPPMLLPLCSVLPTVCIFCTIAKLLWHPPLNREFQIVSWSLHNIQLLESMTYHWKNKPYLRNAMPRISMIPSYDEEYGTEILYPQLVQAALPNW